MCLCFALSFPTPAFLAGSTLRGITRYFRTWGSRLICVCSVKVGDLPLHLTTLIQCVAMVEGREIHSYSTIMASLTPMKVVVARVRLAWLYIWATVDHSFGIALRSISPRCASLKTMPFARRRSKSMFICSMSGCRLWVWLSHMEYAAYMSAAISLTPGVPNLVRRLVHVWAQVVPRCGRRVVEIREPIMPWICSEFSSHTAWRAASTGHGTWLLAMCYSLWDLR